MSIVNIKRASIENFDMAVPVKVDEENRIYLAKAEGPMVFFKANVHVGPESVHVVDATGSSVYQDFVENLTSHYQQLCSDRSEEWFKGRHFPLEFIQDATSTRFKIDDKFYDQNKRRVRRTDLTEGDFEGEAVVEFEGFVFQGKDITSSWVVRQIRLHKEIPDSDFLEPAEEPEEESVNVSVEIQPDAPLETNFADLLE